jgi:hypothetical protein
MEQGPDRRASKPFEPPPWEREQFEELRRKKEEDQADREIEAAVRKLDLPGPVEAQKAPGEPGTSEGEPAAPAAKTELPEGFDAMMAQLAVEEPAANKGAWKAGLVGAGMLVLIGLPLTVWGAFGAVRAAQASAGPAGALGGGIMIVFGLGFLGLGAYTAVRNLRQGGVL